MTVDDGDGGLVTRSHTTTVGNRNPTADADTATTGEGGPAVLIDVLDGDTDPAGGADPLTVTGVDTAGTLGSVSFTAGGVSYDPNGQYEWLAAGETASDSFTYSISDGDGGTAVGAVVVTIQGQNEYHGTHGQRRAAWW